MYARTIQLISASIFLGVLMVGPSTAEVSEDAHVMDLDVVGIKLGMDPVNVEAAMLEHNAGMNIKWTKHTVFEGVQSKSVAGSTKTRGDIISVGFWLPPTGELSSYISRKKTYKPILRPTVGDVKDAFIEKYGLPSYQEELAIVDGSPHLNGDLYLAWVFNKDMSKLSVPDAGRGSNDNTGELRACINLGLKNAAIIAGDDFVDGMDRHIPNQVPFRECKYTLLAAVIDIDKKIGAVNTITTSLADYDDLIGGYTRSLDEYERKKKEKEQKKLEHARKAAENAIKPKL